ncbi:MAG: branched-subunit amino acid transport protein [Alteromonadaceae bacterium]
MTLLTILLMASITFTTRYLFLHPALPIKLSPQMSRLLNFSAPAVLTAIWVPIICVHDDNLVGSLSDPYLMAATVAILVSIKTQSVYWTVGFSMLTFIIVRFTM